MTRKAEREYTYSVNHWDRGTITVQAKDSTQAKRIARDRWGLKPSNLPFGMKCFTARRLF